MTERYQGCLCPLALAILAVLMTGQNARASEEIQFNTEVLDLKERDRLDLSQFSRAGYVMPGTYVLGVQVNRSSLPEREIQFIAPDGDPKGSEPCLKSDTVEQLGLKDSASRRVKWWHNGECFDPSSLPGTTLSGDLGNGMLRVNLPQAWLEYTAENWEPPSRWDNGIPGMLFDYNMTGQSTRQQQTGSKNNALSGNGVTGANLGPWRFRADWQSSYERESGGSSTSRKSWRWDRYYLYRALPALRAKMTLGEDYLSSGMFDSFRFTGAGFVSDDNMLPPNLRGYAPEVTGVARTNAKVTVSQQGRVIYETTVAAGPFRIQDLNDAVTGSLDVKVTEQDGSTQQFQIDTASIPYLTRPGLVRFKFAAGKPSDYHHHSQGPVFGTGEFSWGVSNGWSLFGGGLFAGDYNALAAGIGRDLLVLGALSLDMTQSRAVLPHSETKQGGSYRLSYSKRFDATGSQVTFAGYRFSERNFMSMSQYLDARFRSAYQPGSSKEMYTISFNQQLQALNMTTYLNYNRQTYWDRPESSSYNFSASRYFDAGSVKNLSLSVSAYRTMYYGARDDGVYVSLSLPWGAYGSVSYGGSFSGGRSSHNVGYSGRGVGNDNYRISAGMAEDNRIDGSTYYTHMGDVAEMSLTGNVADRSYHSLGMSLHGGLTATTQGAALHRTGAPGGTRMMVDTDGVSRVPVRSYGSPAYTNMFGKAVVTDVASYYRSDISVDLDKLGNDMEATRSVVQGTLTEGAIGYRRFGIIAGQKAMAVIRLKDGSAPPFGATVLNGKNSQTGIVSEEGSVWLSGINPGEQMKVSWDGETQCSIHLPQKLPAGNLILPCLP